MGAGGFQIPESAPSLTLLEAIITVKYDDMGGSKIDKDKDKDSDKEDKDDTDEG